jgi:hypothetical protein
MKRFRVISGGKSRRNTPEIPTPCLYRAHSTGTFVKGDSVFEEVVFHWYCLERDNPPVAYSDAIAGYEQMDAELRRPFERFVDRHFTEAEVSALGIYLTKRYHLEIQSKRVLLPVKDRAFLFEEGSDVIYEFLELSERQDYPLPFKVWGYFTLQGRKALPSFEKGIEFVEEVLKQLGLALRVDRDRLKIILKSIYTASGLAVKHHGNEDAPP